MEQLPSVPETPPDTLPDTSTKNSVSNLPISSTSTTKLSASKPNIASPSTPKDQSSSTGSNSSLRGKVVDPTVIIASKPNSQAELLEANAAAELHQSLSNTIITSAPLTTEEPQKVLSENPGQAPMLANQAYWGATPITGIEPLFLTSQSQALFKVVIGEDVTTEKMYRIIPKSDFISDMQTRLAISDFTPFKKQILAYPKEELLLHYDPEYKYTQNFFLCVTPEAMDFICKVPEPDKLTDNAIEKTIVDGVTTKSKGAREWKSLGSEKEINMEKVIPLSEPILMKLSRKKSEFKGDFKFGDRDAADSFLEVRPYKDPNYDLLRLEMNVACQAVPELDSSSAQTAWFRPKNFQCQYEAIDITQDAKEQILESSAIEGFVRKVAVRFEKALQHNEIINIFNDDYHGLGDDEAILDHGHHTILQEYQSFTDLMNSKSKCISCIDWHPVQKGIVAVACTKRFSFEDRVDTGANTRPKNSQILIWSFNDPIHPQLILEAPDDILCFQFNQVDPNIVAGGCYNGQVVLWDITEYTAYLKTSRAADSATENNTKGAHKIPSIKYEVVSAIETSHRSSIQDIKWLPKNFELGHNGEPVENSEHGHKQLVTVSLDGSIAFWDLRFKKDIKSLDMTWRPFIRFGLSSLDNSFDYGLTRISINTEITDVKKEVFKGPGSAGTEKKELKSVRTWSSKFYCATEEGDLIYSDWIYEKTSDEKVSRVESVLSNHFGAVSDMHRSPFFPDIILTTGGWSFNIWKENLNVLSYNPDGAPSIKFNVSDIHDMLQDGVLEVWDLLDKSHVPSTTQNISPNALSFIKIHQYIGHRGSQFIGVGDDDGTLHILETPRNLQKSSRNEKTSIQIFFDCEQKRMVSTCSRKQERAAAKGAFEDAHKVAIPKPVTTDSQHEDALTAEEKEAKKEEEVYRKMELEYFLLTRFLQENNLLPPAAEV